MNCKPGDIAIFIAGHNLGRQVHVIKAPPVGVEFHLPNGQLHSAAPAGSWIVESLSGPLPTRHEGWLVSIGLAHDHKLMPIGKHGDATAFEAAMELEAL